MWPERVSTSLFPFQLYELDSDPKRKEFLDDLFTFMQKRGETRPRPVPCSRGTGGRCYRPLLVFDTED